MIPSRTLWCDIRQRSRHTNAHMRTNIAFTHWTCYFIYTPSACMTSSCFSRQDIVSPASVAPFSRYFIGHAVNSEITQLTKIHDVLCSTLCSGLGDTALATHCLRVHIPSVATYRKFCRAPARADDICKWPSSFTFWHSGKGPTLGHSLLVNLLSHFWGF